MTNGIFTQSEKWLEFQKSLGREGWLVEEDGIKAVVIKYDLPLDLSYLYCPYGPIISKNPHPNPLPIKQGEGIKLTLSPSLRGSNLQEFFEKIQVIAKQEKAIFFRCDPQINLSLEKYGLKKAPANYYFSATAMPKNEAILNIDEDEKLSLEAMHHKTRYNISLAEKKGVIAEQSKSGEDVDIFYELLLKTAKREQIKIHGKTHYQKLIEIFGDDVALFIAHYNGKPIAAIMLLFFGKTATYLHGGFDAEYKNLMAPHFLQWQAILEAKKRGCKEYDFGGASLNEKHQWAGVTRFKLGFGAKIVEYPGAYDLIFHSTWYRLYNLTRKIRQK